MTKLKNGDHKILNECSLPLTGAKVVDLIITEKCVFEVNKEEGLTLIELAEGVEIPEILNTTGCEFKVNKSSTRIEPTKTDFLSYFYLRFPKT